MNKIVSQVYFLAHRHSKNGPIHFDSTLGIIGRNQTTLADTVFPKTKIYNQWLIYCSKWVVFLGQKGSTLIVGLPARIPLKDRQNMRKKIGSPRVCAPKREWSRYKATVKIIRAQDGAIRIAATVPTCLIHNLITGNILVHPLWLGSNEVCWACWSLPKRQSFLRFLHFNSLIFVHCVHHYHYGGIVKIAPLFSGSVDVLLQRLRNSSIVPYLIFLSCYTHIISPRNHSEILHKAFLVACIGFSFSVNPIKHTR